MLDLGPDLFRIHLKILADEDGVVVLVRHAVSAICRACLPRLPANPVAFNEDTCKDQVVGRRVAGSPEPVVVVPRDGRRQAVFTSQEIHGSRDPVVAGENGPRS